MKHLIKTTVLAAAALATPSFADSGDVYVTQFSPKPLIVQSNGQDYTQLKAIGNTNMGVKVEYSAGIAGHIKSFWVQPVITNGYGIASPVPGLSAYKYSESYPLLHRPQSINKTIAITIPAVTLANNAVGMCQWLANSLRDDGLSNTQIFGQNREVFFNAGVDYDFDANGAGSNNAIFQANPPYKIPVRCAKWSGAQIPTAGNLSGPFQVIKSTMQLKEIATMGGACKVKLTTAISTNKPNQTVKFRYRHSDGKMSKTFSVKTAANKIAVVTHQWDVPNKPGTETGWFQMKGTTPGFSSNKASYTMNCRDGVGGFKPRPKVSVAIPGGPKRLQRN